MASDGKKIDRASSKYHYGELRDQYNHTKSSAIGSSVILIVERKEEKRNRTWRERYATERVPLKSGHGKDRIRRAAVSGSDEK